MIDPKSWEDVMKYLEEVHFVHQKRPAPPPIQAPKYLRQYNANLSLTPIYNENNFGNNNESNNNENELEMGFKNEEEEEAYKKLKAANYRRFAPGGGKRKTRKLKSKKRAKTAKWTR